MKFCFIIQGGIHYQSCVYPADTTESGFTIIRDSFYGVGWVPTAFIINISLNEKKTKFTGSHQAGFHPGLLLLLDLLVPWGGIHRRRKKKKAAAGIVANVPPI